jgi:hypothetical protein
MMRYTLAGYTSLGTRQSRHGAIAGAEGTIAATRDPLVAVARHGAIAGAEGTIAATRDPLVAVARHGAIAGAEGTIAATRDPLVAAARHAEVDVLGGCLGARSYGVPDVSGGVAAMFKVVYPI